MPKRASRHQFMRASRSCLDSVFGASSARSGKVAAAKAAHRRKPAVKSRGMRVLILFIPCFPWIEVITLRYGSVPHTSRNQAGIPDAEASGGAVEVMDAASVSDSATRERKRNCVPTRERGNEDEWHHTSRNQAGIPDAEASGGAVEVMDAVSVSDSATRERKRNCVPTRERGSEDENRLAIQRRGSESGIAFPRGSVGTRMKIG